MLQLHFFNDMVNELVEGFPDFVLVAVGVELGLVVGVHEGRVADEVLHLWEAGEDLQEPADGAGVGVSASEDIFLVDALLDRGDEYFIGRGHPVAILVQELLSQGLVPAGPGRNAVVKPEELDLVEEGEFEFALPVALLPAPELQLEVPEVAVDLEEGELGVLEQLYVH